MKAKKSAKLYILSAAIVILLIICRFSVCNLRNGVLYGQTGFYISLALHTLCLVLGIGYIVLYFVLFNKNDTTGGFVSCLIICICILPFSVFESIDYYNDVINGSVKFKTETYEICVERVYESNPDRPRDISFYGADNERHTLIISDELYTYLRENNPSDEGRTVYVEAIGGMMPAKQHFVEIEYFRHTDYLVDIQILK